MLAKNEIGQVKYFLIIQDNIQEKKLKNLEWGSETLEINQKQNQNLKKKLIFLRNHQLEKNLMMQVKSSNQKKKKLNFGQENKKLINLKKIIMKNLNTLKSLNIWRKKKIKKVKSKKKRKNM